MYQYAARMIRIVDGDTVWLDVDLGFHIHLHVDVRMAYINSPERVRWTLKGISDPAMNHIQANLPPGAFCVVEISRAEKFGRWLGVIKYMPGSESVTDVLAAGVNLNDELVKKGYAVRYKN
jgi:endonuclease YncB( thermonuclease family)